MDTPEEEVCITTVVVKGPGASQRAAEQHERVSQAFLSGTPGAWGAGGRIGGTPVAGAVPMRSRTLSTRAWAPARRPRSASDRLRTLYLGAALLLLASALCFAYLAIK